MKTARKDFCRPLTLRSLSKLAICRPNEFLRTEMSMASKLFWSRRPSLTLFAKRIIPAQVPNTGRPSPIIWLRDPKILLDSRSIEIVVDSPPGKIMASIPARSSGVRTATLLVPNDVSICWCSEKAPWSANTPTRLDK